MTLINGREYDKVIIKIGGVEIEGVKSLDYTEPEYENELEMVYDLIPLVYLRPPLKHFEPSIIEVIALGKHNNN